MEPIKESELILNPDGSLYHLHLKPENVADTVLLVGDQNRVQKISSRFDSIEFQVENREFVTHTGSLNGKRITVISTGIGTDNIDIVLNELDAAVNVDLQKRIAKTEKRSLNLIRIGTSGSLQPEIPVDSYVLSTHGLGMDGLLYFYKDQSVIDLELTNSFIESCAYPAELPRPYMVEGSESLRELLGEGMISGITATAPGFYAPQGRTILLEPSDPLLNEKIQQFEHAGMRITNFEMETSALFGIGRLLGHSVSTVCAIIANRHKREYSKDYQKTIDSLIDLVLSRLTS